MPSASPAHRSGGDFDAIVIGAGHNGLVTAAYLARGGMSTLLVEARADVGGTAASEEFAGATVNICNCDHLTFRTTPVIEELGLRELGLEYIDVEPAQHNFSWASAADGTGWSHHHDLEATLDDIGRHFPTQVDGYRRYAAAAMPAVRMIFEAAAQPPTVAGLTKLALRRRFSGASTLLRWSRRSAADVLRSFFDEDAILGPAAVTGPMVWGITPEMPGSGLGALTHAMRNVAKVGRPVGGSGQVPATLLAAFEAAGGVLRTKSPVDTIMCSGERVSGIALVDGTEITAPIVVSACNPHDTFLRWLKHPPATGARPRAPMARRASRRGLRVEDRRRAVGAAGVARLRPSARADVGDRAEPGRDRPGRRLDGPGSNPRPARPAGQRAEPARPDDRARRAVTSCRSRRCTHPSASDGGWTDSTEPRRWLETFAELCEPGFLDSIIEWRAMTPDVYERDFHLPAGHATSFAGGPLAAFRNENPELTKYETAVDGLYLTGAATFPGPASGAPAAAICATVILEQRS